MRWSVLALGLLVGCGERSVEIEVQGLVGDEPVECGRTYAGVGTTATELSLADLRMYVHDVRVVMEDGREVPLLLEQDGVWQDGDVVMLDFEDGSADCTSGTGPTHTRIRGTIADGGAIAGVRMTLGVPEDRNHEDVTSAPSPLGFNSMYWGWNSGYKFFRLDGRTTGMADGFLVHLGSTGCEGDGRGNVSGCRLENRAELEVMGFDPDTQALAVDVAALLRDSNMDENLSGPAGCMSGFDDLDCAPIFDGLGLPFGGATSAGPQRLLRVVD